MKKIIALFIGLFFVCVAIQAQELVKTSEMAVVSSETNNVTVQIKVAEQGQLVANRIAQTEVNRKTGFTPTLNADKTLLTLNFTQQFNEKELHILLDYSGVELVGRAFGQLCELIKL